MSYKLTADAAAAWALSKVGCAYSQSKRTDPGYFDCSSLVARAYSAQGKKWYFGGSVPLSWQEVYDDDFELIWPSSYEEIGRSMGGSAVLDKTRSRGDLQFLCTDSSTTRKNRITHVTMVADATTIVQARGTAYGVCTNPIGLYSGKVCAVSRYDPYCALRRGMKGYRTLALQKALNAQGAALVEDGQYGTTTEEEVCAYQERNGLNVTGQADKTTLKKLGLWSEEANDEPVRLVQITGGTVNIRSGPGTQYPVVTVAQRGEMYPGVDSKGWLPILLDGKIRWVSGKYAEEVNDMT